MFTMSRKSIICVLTLTLMFSVLNSTRAQDTLTCETGLTLVAHAMGLTCIPESAQRVVALEWSYVEALLALGMQPIGVADIQGYNRWVKIPIALDEAVVDIGTRNEPNLEKIAELKPDLIIGVQFRLTENYDELSAIAPTVVFNPYPADLSISQYDEMVTTFNTIADVLDRTEVAESVLAELQTTYDNARASLIAAEREDQQFILSQGWTNDNVATFRLFTDNAMAVQVLEQIGLENAWEDDPQLYGYTEVGIEGFAALKDVDINFLYVAQESDNDFFSTSPIWSSLKFVKSDNAYWMGGDVWLFGGPLSARLVVETVLEQMDVELLSVTPEATEVPA